MNYKSSTILIMMTYNLAVVSLFAALVYKGLSPWWGLLFACFLYSTASIKEK